MAIAETARLLASYEFQNKGGPGVNQAIGQLGKLQGASASTGRGTSLLQKGFGLVGQAASGVGGAISHLKDRIGGLLSGPLGMLGLGAGLLSIGGLFKSGIDQARDFGGEVSKLAAITGLTTEQTSRLAGAFHHFGLESDTVIRIAGLTEKNLGVLTRTTKTAGATTNELRTAQERLHVAQLHLSEVEHQRTIRASSLVAAQNRVADAQRKLNDLTAKGGVTVGGASKFFQQYGFAVTDASGRVKDFNQLILTAADYFNNPLIPAQTKAAALAKIFGRNWLELLPVLRAGRKGITDAADEAQRLGLTLTKDNLSALAKLKTATRDWGTALGGLKLQLGLAVVPVLTALTTGATKFLTTADQFGKTGSQKIVGFFKDLVAWGERAFGFIEHNIIPGVKSAIDNWNKLPAPLRSLLFKGFAANQTISFLLGFNPLSVGASIGGAIAAKVGGALAGSLIGKLGGFFGGLLGRTAAQKLIPQVIVGTAAGVVPVFVTNPGFGGPGGIGDLIGKGAPVAGAGGLFAGVSIASIAAAAVAGLGLIVGGGIVLGYLGGFKNRGPTATSTGTPGGLSVGPKGQIRGPAGTASDPIHTTDTRTEAAIERQAVRNQTSAQNLYNLGTSARAREGGPLPVNKPITASEFERILKTTPFLGTKDYKSIFEAFTTATPARGGDPFGQNFAHLVSTLANPKAPAVMTEIKGHLAELKNLEAYYIAHGDVAAAKKVQDVVNQINVLIGVTKVDDTATKAEHQKVGQAVRDHKLVSTAGFRALDAETKRTSAAVSGVHTGITSTAAATARHLSTLEGLGSATSANTLATSRKNFSPTLNNYVSVTSNVSVSSVIGTITRITTGLYAGKPVPLG